MNGGVRRSTSGRCRGVATVLTAAALLALPWAQPANACFTGTSTDHPSDNGSDFKIAQFSQGGNFYYGTAGTLTPAPPPNPESRVVDTHINAFFASADQRFEGSSTPGLIHAGWAIGFHQYNSTHLSLPTIVAETFTYSSVPVLFNSTTAAGSGVWYKTQLSHGNPNGTWHFDAWAAPSGTWVLLGNGVDLTTSTTDSQSFGEISDTGNLQASTDPCLSATGTTGGHNMLNSMQLYVDNAAWQNWDPAHGRWACAQTDRQSPYFPGPGTISSTDCTQGTFWDIAYTDFQFWGP